jgi:6,7-dimethyl-8-ribityllumazine synthase
MSTIIEGMLDASGKSYAIIICRFNELIGKKLMEGALDCLIRHRADEKKITIVWVPGSFEIPIVANKLARSDKYDAIICLGAVIRGSTPHFDYVATEVSKGVAHVGLTTGKPVIFGVLTTDTIEQAIERAGTKAGNKGFNAALNAIEMTSLLDKL